MKGKNLRVTDTRSNTITLRLDASFFFERAVRSLDRNHYDKALKYFRKAVEYEPDNPVNHCNMAGILSEMGNYTGSNEVLNHVLTHVNPSMTECYFYMANNYANMEQFEEAERALVTYLEEDEEGQYLEEAEDMMELLYYELNRPTKLNRIKARGGVVEHDQARKLLEEGKFAQAARLLEQISGDQPELHAARNNLALSYYYMGMFKKAKETILQVLESDPGNLHALCNLAIFYQNEGGGPHLDTLIKTLAVTVPFQHDQVFKLGTTMGILEHHEEAYHHFRRLLRQMESGTDPSLYHYAAVAASNTGRYDEALRLWAKVQKLDPTSEIPKFYVSRMDELKSQGKQLEKLSYHYHLPFDEQFKLWEKYGSRSMPDDMKKDPLVRSSFFWALHHGDDATRLQVIHALELIGDEEVRQALETFLTETGLSETLYQAASKVLREMDVENPEQEAVPSVVAIPEQPRSDALFSNSANTQLQAVLDRAVSVMGQRYDATQINDLKQLWSEYVNHVGHELVIQHVEGWSAALEYLTAKMNHKRVTYREVADYYGISVSTISRYARQIDTVCGISTKTSKTLKDFTERV